MFKESIIKECFFELGQFAQPTDPAYPLLDTRLTTSITGRAINRVHPLLKIENIYNVAPEFGSYVYDAWVTGVAIGAGKLVTYNNQVYVSLVALTALTNIEAPDTSTNFDPSHPFSNWLVDICEQSAIELVSLLIQHKKLQTMTKGILESTMLYQGGGLLSDREVKSNRFVGYRIELASNENLVTTIASIGIQLDEPIAALPIYLYHSSRQDAVSVGSINAEGGLSFNWTEVSGFDLRSVDFSKYDNGGYFYLGYYEADLGTAQAISKRMNISHPCRTCNRYNGAAYSTWSKRFALNSIQVLETDLSPTKTLFDTSKVVLSNDRNYGLNMSISTQCDPSSFFCRHKALFSDAYAKIVALNLIKQIAYTTRINAIPEMTRQAAAAELDPKSGSGSLQDEFNKALKAIDYDFSGLDADCLPCSTRGKIRYGTI